jgi:hypothetical protein
VTIGPDLDWLADDEGNLRPHVARELANAPPLEPVRQPEPQPEPRRVAEQVARHHATPPAPRIAHPFARPRVSAPLLMAGVLLAGLVGFAVGKWPRTAVESSEGAAAGVAATASSALVNGINVNLRTGPGLGFPVLARLVPAEALQVRGEQAGWYSVATNTGLGGWVFGAFLRGARTADRGPAVVTQLLASDGNGPGVVLRPGDKVFVARQPNGSSEIVLPNGRHLRVSPDVLALVD